MDVDSGDDEPGSAAGSDDDVAMASAGGGGGGGDESDAEPRAASEDDSGVEDSGARAASDDEDFAAPKDGPSQRAKKRRTETTAAAARSPPRRAEPTFKTVTFRVADVNPHLACSLCEGYFRDAHTITKCLHTFCKTCILAHLRTSREPTCPRCRGHLGPHPMTAVLRDRTLQSLVDRPSTESMPVGLGWPWKGRRRRREKRSETDFVFSDFRSARGTRLHGISTSQPRRCRDPSLDDARGESTLRVRPRPQVDKIFPEHEARDREQRLEIRRREEPVAPPAAAPPPPPPKAAAPSSSNETEVAFRVEQELQPGEEPFEESLDKPYIKTSGQLKVQQLRKYLAKKLKQPVAEMELACQGESLAAEHSLQFIKRSLWVNPKEELIIHYRRVRPDGDA